MDASLIFVPKIILEIAKDVSKIGPYINSLEAEMKKIGDFSLEIPCSILIFTKAIETLKKEANKMEWLDDAQLWPDRGISMLGEYKMGCLYKPRPNRGGTFVSYKSWELYKDLSASPLANEIGKRSSSFGIFVKGNEPKRANESSVCKKKDRRCWSQELHRLFVDAIEQLGGAQVAKPKQIKEVMRVRGLTNAEIKSHLQASHPLKKFRYQIMEKSKPKSGGDDIIA